MTHSNCVTLDIDVGSVQDTKYFFLLFKSNPYQEKKKFIMMSGCFVL